MKNAELFRNGQIKPEVLEETWVEQFNRDEQRWRLLQWRKLKRRVRFPKLGVSSHAILDLRDEMRERRSQAGCS